VTASSVALRWSDNSSNETGFKLERSVDGVNFTEIATLGAGTTSFTDNAVAARTRYYYRARAYNSIGASGYSNTLSVTTSDVQSPPPAAPGSVVAQDGTNGSAVISWADASSNETGFEVRRETWNDKKKVWGSASTIGKTAANITSLVDVSGNGTYRYYVRAVNASGASAYAGPAEVTVTTVKSTQKGNGNGGGNGGGNGNGNKKVK
jgi:predicted phage tail protein